MDERRKKADIIREEKKRQLLNFIERKKAQVIPSKQVKILLSTNKKEKVHSVNKEAVPKEAEKTYIEGSNRRKKRREKLQEIREKREEIKKKRVLAAYERKQRKVEERRKKKERVQQKKLEALKKREEARKLREEKKKEVLKKKPVKPIPVPSKKKEDLLALINKIKEKHQIEYNQQLLRKQVAIAEKKLKIEKAKEEQRQKKLEALKKREEARKLREEKKKEKIKVIPVKEIPSTPYTKKKEELIEFLRTRKVLYEQEKERKKILRQISAEKRKVRVIPVKAVEKITKEILPTAIITKISTLSKEASRVEKEAKDSIAVSSGNIKHFISRFTKKTKELIEKQIPVVPEKKPIVKYKEPFLLIPFIKRNIFKFVLFILFIGWVYEIFFFMERLVSPQERLSKIVGEDITKEKTVPSTPAKEEKLPVTEAEFEIALKKEKIDIEGKRDPFSPGLLTMQVFEKPEATNIALASKASVISILKPSRIVSIIREEKKMEPEKVASISKPQTPFYQPIVKEKAPSPIQPVEKVKPAETSSLIMPERRCDLIYRGRLVIEGVEYLFIEGASKTYRVTIGDVVEGFRILRKEKDKIYLSKEGIIYEIPVD